ncbi:ferredoxin reductase-like protein [Eremomyces bilateralis CBS 781.70]|uniref:NADH-cytochrome b5 reductase n=1 Tax=Eremomyces bilateralis CBS 781.70 TaxID=1392243 RepID=A0A6G1G202_9PEZI|nr:ferredoxin reductase-like protein [Eremomyces bilateralis CBS 781.70]KAF1812137.1 ferredoxin reductase-like protein [Eremomyces bilateralis CBS 781.70]
MFARQVFQPVRTLQTQVRRYASEAPKSGGGSNSLLIAGFLGAATAGGYYYLTSDKAGAAKATAPTTPSEPVFKGGDQGFISLKLDKIETLTHNTKHFTFSFEDPNAVAGLPVASAILTKYKGPEMEKPVIRPYTPVSAVDEKGHIDFVIKKYEKGPMSTHMHDMLEGQRLDFKGPIPKYPWETNKHEHVVMIAGGTGITPMYQVMRRIFENPEDKTKVTLVFGNVSEGDILLKRELYHLENTYPQRFKAFYVLDSPPESWSGGVGYVTKELLKTVMPEPKEGEKVKVFVCGPPGLYKSISGPKKSPANQGELTGFLKELGYSPDQVYKF